MAGRSWFGPWRRVSRFDDDARLYSGVASEAVESSRRGGGAFPVNGLVGWFIDQSLSDDHIHSGTDIDVRAQGLSGGCAAFHRSSLAYSNLDGFHDRDD